MFIIGALAKMPREDEFRITLDSDERELVVYLRIVNAFVNPGIPFHPAKAPNLIGFNVFNAMPLIFSLTKKGREEKSGLRLIKGSV